MKMTNVCKLAFAILAFALPLAANADNSPMSSDGKMMMSAMPKAGDKAADFTLKTLDDKSIQFSDLTAKSDVVLVVLRGWPGYQCPICTRQVNDFAGNAEKFKAAGVQVLMVYPGPADDLKAHGAEFLADKSWPKDFMFVLDPDYSFTKAYGLRWDAPKETAYPSTFIVSKEGKIAFAHISKQHGGRTSADAVLKSLKVGMMKADMKTDMMKTNTM